MKIRYWALLLLFLALPAAAPAQTRELVVAGWGDPYLAAWKGTLIPKFEGQYHAKVIWVPGFSTQTLVKIKAGAAKPDIDVALLDEGPHQDAVEAGLIEPIDPTKLHHYSELFPKARRPGNYGIGFAVNGTGIYYNTEIFKQKGWAPPRSWTDLLDPKYAGHVSAHSIVNGNGLSLFLALNTIYGGDPAKGNVEPGFQKMRLLAKSIPTFDRQGESYQLIQQGIAWIGEWSIDRISALQQQNVPVEFVYPREGVYGFLEVATVVKGRPNADLAHQFIDLLLSPEEQVHTATTIGLGPLNGKAKLTEAQQAKVIYGERNIARLKIPDWTVVNKNRPTWTERWNKEVEAR